MVDQNALTRLLKIKYPIIQGPFGGGFSTSKLAAAVSNYGGLGSFGAHHLTPQEIIEKVKEIKTLTDNPFAINLWVSNADDEARNIDSQKFNEVAQKYKKYFDSIDLKLPSYPEKFGENFDDQVNALIEAKPAVFSFVFGVPNAAILERCRKAGIVTVGAATTLDEALAVEKAGVDCVVILGFEAGGHRPSFLKTSEQSLMGMGALLAQAVQKLKIPVIAAGGISNKAGIEAAQVLGAQGVQMGTAFLACEESGASVYHREVIFSKQASHTILSRHYTGRLARFIENTFTRETRAQQTEYLPYPAQNYLLKEFKKVSSELGKGDITALYAGQGAPLLKYKNVKDLMDSLTKPEYKDHL